MKWAFLSENNIVLETFVDKDAKIKDEAYPSDPSRWVDFEKIKPQPDFSWTYDSIKNKFFPPKPDESYVFNETYWMWEDPNAPIMFNQDAILNMLPSLNSDGPDL